MATQPARKPALLGGALFLVVSSALLAAFVLSRRSVEAAGCAPRGLAPPAALLPGPLGSATSSSRTKGSARTLPLPKPGLALAPNGWPAAKSAVLTNDTLPAILQRAAAPAGLHPTERAVVFTTFDLREGSAGIKQAAGDEKRILPALRNLCWHLQKQRLLQHTLLVTNNKPSWEQAREAGIPAYLDLASPVKMPVIDQKHWLAARFLEHGYNVVYMDVDVAVLGDLLQPFRTTDYDIQGLSDWEDPDLPPTGAFWKEFNPETGYTISVRQSTGLFYARATPGARHFMDAFATRQYFHNNGWEQARWNEMLPFFLWGMGDSAPPVKYRVLPHSRFCNVGVYGLRVAMGLPVAKMIALHAGFVDNEAKNEAFERLGMWHPDEFQLEVWRHEQTRQADVQAPRRQGAYLEDSTRWLVVDALKHMLSALLGAAMVLLYRSYRDGVLGLTAM